MEQINLQITSDPNYQLASTTPTSVKVQDKDLIPEVSIALISTAAIEEGETAVFELTAANPEPTSDFNVPVIVAASAGGGDFLDSRDALPSPVQISGTSNKGTLSIRTVSDDVVETSGTITVTLQPDPAASDSTKDVSYLVTTSSSLLSAASVTVLDNDIAGVAEITIAGPSVIDEGSSAEYTFTNDTPTSGSDEINVLYRITEVGSFLQNPATLRRTETIKFVADDATKTISLATIADAVPEGNGTVVVQILAHVTAGTGLQYSVGPASLVRTTIIDDDDADLPNVTIAPKTASVVEGTDTHATFTLTATTGTGTGNFNVELSISQEGDFYHSTTNPVPSPSIARGSTTDFQVQLNDDGTEEVNGSITVELLFDSAVTQTYSTGATTSATVAVIDNDAPSTISITDASDFERNDTTDDQTLTFEVRLSTGAMNQITVDYVVGKVGDTAEVTTDYTDATVLQQYLAKLSSMQVKQRKISLSRLLRMKFLSQMKCLRSQFLTQHKGLLLPILKPLGTIRNDDVEPTFPIVTIVDALTVSEHAGEVAITAELSKRHDAPVTIDLQVVRDEGTATPVSDFNFADGRIVIAPGETTGTKTFRVVSESELQDNETFFIQASLTNGSYPAGTPNLTSKRITVTITELPNVTIETDFTEVADSDYFEYTVTRTPETDTALTVSLNADSFSLATDSNADVSSITIDADKPSATGRVSFSTLFSSVAGETEGDFVLSLASSANYTSHPNNDEILVKYS